MKIIRAGSIDTAYSELLSYVLASSAPFNASRLGPAKDVGLCLIELSGTSPHLLRLKERALNPFLAVMEACWILAGRDELKPMELAVRSFKQFSDDGTTLYGAYGKRLRRADNIDQIEGAISALKSDPTTRRVFLSIYQARDLSAQSRDIPCNLGMILISREGELEATVINRSNDAVLGVPYDVFSFSVIHWHVARELGLRKGVYRHFSNCMHLYERDLAISEAVAQRQGAEAPWSEGEVNALVTEMVRDADAIAALDFDRISSPRLKRFFVGLASWRASGDVAGLNSTVDDAILGEMVAQWMVGNKIGIAGR